jgi:hypothetical protein
MEKKDLLDRIYIQKAVQSYYYTRTHTYSVITKILMLLLPAVVTFISCSDLSILNYLFGMKDKVESLTVITIISFCLFLLSIYIEVFNINTKSESHKSAINRLIKLKHEYCHQLDLDQKNEVLITEKYQQLYTEIIESSPQFTDNQFIKGKKEYIKKMSKMKELDKQFYELQSK